MQKIIVDQLGPVKHCELEIQEFTVFTGPQASGKSTIAKSVFFFKNIKNLLITQLRRRYATMTMILPTEDTSISLSLKGKMLREIRSNFLQIFGSTWCMSNNMKLQYYYTDDTYIIISLKPDPTSPNYIWIDFSKNLSEFLEERDEELKGIGESPFYKLETVIKRVETFFEDDAEVVYIPAGRSMITLLNTQLNYIYSSMDDAQKRNLDYCTQNYLERILQLKTGFSVTPEQMIMQQLTLTDLKLNRELLNKIVEMMRHILGGDYRLVNGEERLQVTEERYVKINFASSGQQEAVWILNVIFYYLLNNRKTYFIIEEPESHLFPNAQKLMTEFIALSRNKGQNGVFITTHSPYILGTINNLLYADKISQWVKEGDLEKIIDKDKWISFQKLVAYYIESGKVQKCVDEEFQTIKNEVIDGASEEINSDYDKMIELKERYMGGKVVENAANEGKIIM